MTAPNDPDLYGERCPFCGFWHVTRQRRCCDEMSRAIIAEMKAASLHLSRTGKLEPRDMDAVAKASLRYKKAWEAVTGEEFNPNPLRGAASGEQAQPGV